jgi:hypothetical protein
MELTPGDFRGFSQFDIGQQVYPQRSSGSVAESEAIGALMLRDPELVRSITARFVSLDPNETIELEDPKEIEDVALIAAASSRGLERMIKRERRQKEVISGRIVNAAGQEQGSVELCFKLGSYAGGLTTRVVRRVRELFDVSRPSEDERPSKAQESSRVLITLNR